MKKLYLLLFVALLCCTSCGTGEVPASGTDIAAETADFAPEKEPLQVRIYYCPIGTGGLEVALEEVNSLTAESILSHLSRHNIVSIDTKVADFSEGTMGKDRILYLDLTKPFGEYLNTMGVQSEEIIMAALTNTFLDAYGADALAVTVGGATLRTSNREYAEPLRYQDVRGEQGREENSGAQPYRIERVEPEEYQDVGAGTRVAYPRLVGLADEEIEGAVNERIEQYVNALHDVEGLEGIACDYEVTYQDAEEVCIVMRASLKRTGGDKAQTFAATFHIDWRTGRNIRLKDMASPEWVARMLRGFTDCTLPDGMEAEVFEERLAECYPDLENILPQFDFDFEQIWLTAPGFSYRTEQGIGLLLPMSGKEPEYAEVLINALPEPPAAGEE